MPDPMIGSYEDPPRAERVEVITSVQRRRRWPTEEKVRIVEETYLPGNSVSLVARRYGIAVNQLFTWRRLRGNNTQNLSVDHFGLSGWAGSVSVLALSAWASALCKLRRAMTEL